ncbi:MAG: arginase family protein [Nanoarchaeota archaeon]
MVVIIQDDENSVISELKRARDFSFIKIKNKLLNEDFESDKVLFIGEDDFNCLKKCSDYYFKNLAIIFDSGVNSIKNFINAGFFRENLIAFGLRNLSLEDRQFLDSNKIRYHEMKNVEDIEFACDSLMEFINKSDHQAVISFNLSVVDPSFAPSLIDFIPGGLSSREIVYFAKRLSLVKNVKLVLLKGIDYEADKNNKFISSKLGAMVLWEFIK